MKKFALLGGGISYSLSPKIHTFIMRLLGKEGTYVLEDVEQAQLDAELKRMLLQYDGFNITKPYKKDVMSYLDCDTCVCAGAVNLAVRERDGWKGYNVDGEGFYLSVRGQLGHGYEHALILGAGGAARAVAGALYGADVQAGGKGRLYVLNRSKDKQREFCADLPFMAEYDGCAPDVIVNCTSAGLHGENPLQGANVPLEKVRFAFDAIYAPPETEFLKACARAGAATVNGLGMLVYQAVLSQLNFWELKLKMAEIDSLAAKTMEYLKRTEEQ